MNEVSPSSYRGFVRQPSEALSQEDVESLLTRAFCGRTATMGEDGYPYISPNLFVWKNGQVYLHTPRHQGHFLANVRHADKVSFEVDETGEIFPYGHVECDTSVSYRSVIIFGRIRTIEDDAEKRAFFGAFLTKYAPKDSLGARDRVFPAPRRSDRLCDHAGHDDRQMQRAAGGQ